MHIDSWLDCPSDPKKIGECYAKFFLVHRRMPAWMVSAFTPWLSDRKLFCTYKGKRYRCTGASRLGDIWLTSDFERDHGYELRIDVMDCTDWSDNFGIPSWRENNASSA